jgi:transposase
MAGKKGQKKRVWSDDEKRSICAQARVSGVSVAQVARRYAMNTNLIHKWLRDPRFASEGQAADLSVPDGATFLPVEVAGMEPVMAARDMPKSW